MGETPDEIREDIERTRERMSEHADALAYKADVPARTKDRIEDAKENVMSTLSHAKDAVVSTVTGAKDTVADKAADAKHSVGSTVSDHTPSTGEVKHQAARAKGIAQDNPLGLAIGAVALGFVAGLLVPASRFENERVGGLADEVKDRAKTVGQDAVERVKDVAATTATAAKDAAADAGSHNAEEFKETASAGSRLS